MSDSTAWLGGRYELISVIGRGGMAEVWRARDHRLGRDVAVKRLRTDLASDETFQARFQREAQAAAGLNHPNIVAVYDTGDAPDPTTGLKVPYIVMELVEGHTLRDVLRDGRKIRPERALEFTAGVLDALSYSHAAGIVHRDIKPANVMLTASGLVKVMDFGIARAVADTSATMTQTAAVIGTAQYLSPEQARGETVDNRADIYATGCLLYELLVGRPPFVGDSPVSVAYQHVREVPAPPSALDPEITPAMDDIALKALAKDPADRYQSAKQMRDDITALLEGGTPRAVLDPAPADSPTQVGTRVIPAATAATAGDAAATTTTPMAPARAAGDGEADDRAPTEPDRPRRRWPVVLVVVLAVILLSLLGYGAYTLMSGSDKGSPSPTVTMVKVPAVTGLSEAGATSMLQNAGLKAKATHVNDDPATAGQVISQNPVAGGSVAAGSEVEITVNDGPKQVTIPGDLVGKSVDEARKALVKAGIPSNRITTKDADPREEDVNAKPGTVTAVSPDQGSQVAADTDVTLTVATGTSAVPNLHDLTAEAATEAAKRAGFGVTFTTAHDSQTKGQVFAQSPEPGATAKRGSTIKVTVSDGPAPPSTVTATATATVTQPSQEGPSEPGISQPNGTATR